MHIIGLLWYGFIYGGEKMSKYDEKSKQYSIQYAKDKLHRVPLNIPKEEYAELKQAAADAGQSVNGFIKQAIRERINSLNIETYE